MDQMSMFEQQADEVTMLYDGDLLHVTVGYKFSKAGSARFCYTIGKVLGITSCEVDPCVNRYSENSCFVCTIHPAYINKLTELQADIRTSAEAFVKEYLATLDPVTTQLDMFSAPSQEQEPPALIAQGMLFQPLTVRSDPLVKALEVQIALLCHWVEMAHPSRFDDSFEPFRRAMMGRLISHLLPCFSASISSSNVE